MKVASLALALLAACSAAEVVPEEAPQAEQVDDDDNYFPNVGDYEASPEQLRADQSFSEFLIETTRQDIESQLTQIVENGCAEYIECDWADAMGVRHYFVGVREDEHLLVVKSVHADEFEGRPIPALGIGMARSRDEVLANVRDFLPTVAFVCTADGASEQCDERVLRPGWLRIWFEDGQLKEVRLDGYHFT